MLFDMLILFVLITIITFILSVFLVEDRPLLSIPIVMIGMIFSILCTYGLWDVEFYTTGYNSTLGNTSMDLSHITTYGDPYGYVFMLIFFVFMVLFIRAGFNLWKEALETEGQIDYRMKTK